MFTGGPEAGRRGLPHDNLGAKTSTFEDPTDQNTTKIPREDPQREEKRHEKDTRREKKKMKMGVGEGKKKARNFAPPTLRGPTLPGPTLPGPHLF